MSKKRNGKISMIYLAPKPSKSFFFSLPYTKQRRQLRKKIFFIETKECRIEQNPKEWFLTALSTAIQRTHNINKKTGQWIKSPRGNGEGGN